LRPGERKPRPECVDEQPGANRNGQEQAGRGASASAFGHAGRKGYPLCREEPVPPAILRGVRFLEGDSVHMGTSVELKVRTSRKIERRDISEEVTKAAASLGAGDGALLISLPHTTAAVTVGENWDADVTSDMERALADWVPDVRFDHSEGNSP